ncbi:MAG: hypothetical protein KAI47_06630 [Deltaproteobacteria bacterium]|nr:hypothetical protein [Deltaproteobacteria bacterium]
MVHILLKRLIIALRWPVCCDHFDGTSCLSPFVPFCGPSDEEVYAICDQVARRVLRLIRAEDDMGDDYV